jgi:extracellular factor (EF) 3-hydroxypalmitic acid methyl ester biosynthesis protein
VTDVANATDSLLSFRNSQGVESRGTLMSLTRHLVVFEVYNPYSIVQLSEVLSDLRIRHGERAIYDGKAVVSNLVNTGIMLIVSATLVDPWSNLANLLPGQGMRAEIKSFLQDWEVAYLKLLPAYQNAVSTFRNFLEELSRWLSQGEIVAGIGKPNSPPDLMGEFLVDVEVEVKHKLGELMLHFEQEAAQVPPDVVTVHKAFAQRELHPLMLCSPFLHRTFTKPLGYAGDYEMVNMIVREQAEGPSVYAKIINLLNLRTGAAMAHRNRIDILVKYLTTEAMSARKVERPLRLLNVACGPAEEVRRFILNHELANQCELKLLDFNAETLSFTRQRLEEAMRTSGHRPNLEYIHKSIHELLKESTGRRETARIEAPYDFVYCAGLFDYLSDKICQRLLRLFTTWIRPGGLVLATNVHTSNPNRLYMDHLLEWHLIYRDEAAMLAIAPPDTDHLAYCDATGINVFLEIRKRAAGP